MRRFKVGLIALLSAAALAPAAALAQQQDAGPDAGTDAGTRKGGQRRSDGSRADGWREQPRQDSWREQPRQDASRDQQQQQGYWREQPKEQQRQDSWREQPKQADSSRRSDTWRQDSPRRDNRREPARVTESSGGEMLSVLSGQSLRSSLVVHVQFGWPGLYATLLTSLSDRLDLGGKLSLVYAYEGISGMAGTPGLKAQAVVRLALIDRGRINLGLRFEPGFFIYAFPGGTEIGLPLPVDLAFGLAITPQLMLNLGIDFPIFAVFGPYGGVAVPVRIGGGLEYALDRNLALTLNLRAGPSVPLTGYGYAAYWNWYWCYDARGRPYRCGGGYYSFQVPSAEALLGILIRL